MKTQKRTLHFNVRADDDQTKHRLVGTPIVFNSRTTLYDGVEEVIEPTALDNADLTDVRFLVNHDVKQLPLARYVKGNDNNTMDLTIDSNGVNVSIDLDVENSQRAKDLYSAVQRGDVTGMSFMFEVEDYKVEKSERGGTLNRITDIAKVYEVSAVTFPAYEDTSIEARSKKEIPQDNVEMLKLKCKILGGF